MRKARSYPAYLALATASPRFFRLLPGRHARGYLDVELHVCSNSMTSEVQPLEAKRTLGLRRTCVISHIYRLSIAGSLSQFASIINTSKRVGVRAWKLKTCISHTGPAHAYLALEEQMIDCSGQLLAPSLSLSPPASRQGLQRVGNVPAWERWSKLCPIHM